MPIIKQNDIIDVIYETICGYEPEKAYEILELYRTKRLIPIDWIKDYVGPGISDDIFQRNRKFVLNMINDWEKENGLS